MDEHQSAAYYKRLIDQAESYHDLVILRSRFFALMDRTLPKEDCLAVRDHWNAKAKQDSLPIAPTKQQA